MLHTNTDPAWFFCFKKFIINMHTCGLGFYLNIFSFYKQGNKRFFNAIYFVGNIACKFLALTLWNKHHFKFSISGIGVRGEVEVRADR